MTVRSLSKLTTWFFKGATKVLQYFGTCEFAECITRMKKFKSGKVPKVFNSIVVVGALTRCALLQSVYYLKATQTNMQHHQIQELMFYKFVMSYKTAKVTKNICCTKSESTVDHNTVTKWLKKFCLGHKNLNNQVRSGRPKIIDFIEANPANRTWRI